MAWHSRVHSPSPSTSDYEADDCEPRRPFNREDADSVEQRHQPARELPLRRRTRQSHSSFASHGSTTGNPLGGWGNVVQLIKNDLSEQGYQRYCSEDELFEPIYKLERILSRRKQPWDQQSKQRTGLSRHSSMREGDSRDSVGRIEWSKRSDYKDSGSVRLESGQVKNYSCCDWKSGDGQRRVRFQDDQKRRNFSIDNHRASEENHGGRREPGSFTVRQYQGDVQVGRRTSWGEVNRAYRHEANEVRNFLSHEIKEDEEDHGRLRERRRWERASCRVRAEHRSKVHTLREEWRREGGESRRYNGEPSRRWQGNQEDRSSTEDEEVDRERERRREETRAPRRPQRGLSSASFRGRSSGAGNQVLPA